MTQTPAAAVTVHRLTTVQRWLACCLLLPAMLIAGLVPQGYMPSVTAKATDDAAFLVLCSGAVLPADPGLGDASSDGDGVPLPMCLFSLLTQPGMPVAPALALLASAIQGHTVFYPTGNVVSHTSYSAGFPIGSRAPPRF